MTANQVFVIFAVVAVIAFLAVRGWGGPRVTEIDRTVRKEKDGDDA